MDPIAAPDRPYRLARLLPLAGIRRSCVAVSKARSNSQPALPPMTTFPDFVGNGIFLCSKKYKLERAEKHIHCPRKLDSLLRRGFRRTRDAFREQNRHRRVSTQRRLHCGHPAQDSRGILQASSLCPAFCFRAQKCHELQRRRKVLPRASPDSTDFWPYRRSPRHKYEFRR